MKWRRWSVDCLPQQVNYVCNSLVCLRLLHDKTKTTTTTNTQKHRKKHKIIANFIVDREVNASFNAVVSSNCHRMVVHICMRWVMGNVLDHSISAANMIKQKHLICWQLPSDKYCWPSSLAGKTNPSEINHKSILNR